MWAGLLLIACLAEVSHYGKCRDADLRKLNQGESVKVPLLNPPKRRENKAQPQKAVTCKYAKFSQKQQK